MIRNSPLKKRERSEPKCVPQLFLESLLGTRRSYIVLFFYQLYRTNPRITFLLNLFLSLHPLLFFLFLCRLCLLPLCFQSIFGIFCYFVKESPRCISLMVSLGFLAIFLRISVILLPCHNKVVILTKNK